LSFDLLRRVGEAEPLRAVSLSNGRWAFFSTLRQVFFSNLLGHEPGLEGDLRT